MYDLVIASFMVSILSDGGGIDISWTSGLVKKLKALKKITPITRLDSYRIEEEKNYDLLAIGVKVIDSIIDNMGFVTGLTKDRIAQEITPMVQLVDGTSEIKKEKEFYIDLVKKVIDKLLNKGERQRFSEDYVDYSTNPPVLMRHDFAILSERYTGTDIELQVEPEAINIFLQSLDVDIEDTQEAYQHLIEIQLKRGKVGKAIEYAKANKQLSTMYSERIKRYVEETRRNLLNVDWAETVPKVLEEAMNHIEGCTEREISHLNQSTKELNHLVAGNAGPDRISELETLKRLLTDALTIHTRLSQDIMVARETFHDEQQRQIFQPVSRRRSIDIEEMVFSIALQQRNPEHEMMMEHVYPFIGGFQIPKLIDLNTLVESAFKTTKKGARTRESTSLDLLKQKYEPLKFFSDDLHVSVVAFVQAAIDRGGGATSFSDLARAARAEARDHLFIELIKVFVALNYAVRSLKHKIWPNHFIVELAGTTIQDPGFEGTEFIIKRAR